MLLSDVDVPTPLNPETKLIREVLSDGQWHKLDELVQLAGPVIPPGRAMRKREKDRVRARRQTKTGRTLTPTPRSTEYLVAVGRRSLITKAVLDRRAYDVRRDDDGTLHVRLRTSADDTTQEGE